jgi:hypothetical protein
MIVIARLNDRAMPLDRGDIYEDPLDDILQEKGIGEVSGGGTQLKPNGEIEYCDVEIDLVNVSAVTVSELTITLEKLGAPKGSKLLINGGNEEIPFGKLEGLAVYLNGTDLPKSTYKECDVNYVYSEFNRLLEGIGGVHSYWQGPTETALYLYGNSVEQMKSVLRDFLDTYPLCEKARLIQIA